MPSYLEFEITWMWTTSFFQKMMQISSNLLLELEYLQDNMNMVQVELSRCVNSLHLQSQKASQILFRLTKVTAMVRSQQEGNTVMKMEGDGQKEGLKVLKCVEESAVSEAPETITIRRPVLKTKSQVEKMS